VVSRRIAWVAVAVLLLAACGNDSKARVATAGGSPDAGSMSESATSTSDTSSSASQGTAGTGHADPGRVVYPNEHATTAPRNTTTTAARPTTTVAPLPVTGSGVRGTVTAGPTCPVERPDQPCPPRPVSARIDARDDAGRTAASTTSDADGRYAMSLAHGHYTLVVVTSESFPRCPDTSVTVQPNEVTTADISCDTGIR
jgi:hypothetical protein